MIVYLENDRFMNNLRKSITLLGRDWRVSVSELDGALEDAVAFTQEWFKR
jgi:hypothetical protein